MMVSFGPSITLNAQTCQQKACTLTPAHSREPETLEVVTTASPYCLLDDFLRNIYYDFYAINVLKVVCLFVCFLFYCTTRTCNLDVRK